MGKTDGGGACTGCGDVLRECAAVFASCVGCGAYNYRPPTEPFEAKLARFWGRARLAPGSQRG